MTEYNHSVTIDGASGDLLPTPKGVRLKTADVVRLEMARVYHDVRLG